jgi:hypothetical protein
MPLMRLLSSWLSCPRRFRRSFALHRSYVCMGGMGNEPLEAGLAAPTAPRQPTGWDGFYYFNCCLALENEGH